MSLKKMTQVYSWVYEGRSILHLFYSLLKLSLILAKSLL